MRSETPFSDNALKHIAHILATKFLADFYNGYDETAVTGIIRYYNMLNPAAKDAQAFFQRIGFQVSLSIDSGSLELQILQILTNIQETLLKGKEAIIRIIEQLSDREEYFSSPVKRDIVLIEINKILEGYDLEVTTTGKVVKLGTAGVVQVQAAKTSTNDRQGTASQADHRPYIKAKDVQEVEEAIKNVERIARNFHFVAEQLTIRRGGREAFINDELDQQDLFYALLKLYFRDIRPEEPTTSTGGKKSRIDFLLKTEQIAIELKHTRPGLGDSKVTEELNIDILSYHRSHPDCKIFIAFVFDPKHYVRNPVSIENDLSKPVNDMQVRIFINQG